MPGESVEVAQADRDKGAIVGRLVRALLSELAPEGREVPAADEFERVATGLLTGDCGYWAFLARDASGEPVGLLTLNECAATYARGRFGEIAELYVLPKARSAGVGVALLRAAMAFGRDRVWNHLEVGAPGAARFPRTIAFYVKHGFAEVGPRLRLTL
jgi:GNAT superfamily N-acetyltransferase